PCGSPVAPSLKQDVNDVAVLVDGGPKIVALALDVDEHFIEQPAFPVCVSDVFDSGRGLAAWLGLVPKQISTGGRPRLGSISKRGDRYLHSLLIHGARSVIQHLGEEQDRRSCWLRQLVARRGKNVASVALANKNARIIWALMTHDEDYRRT
ncbi:MAG: hypothetical protein ACI8PT_004347, partial [Gammaproteobacteria bacterium]